MIAPTQRAGELAIAGVLFVIGLIWVLGTLDMPKGDFSVPGPGLFPVLLGLALCGASLALGGSVIWSRTSRRVPVGNAYIWSTPIALIALAILFERLGFVLSITLFIGFFLKLLSDLKWGICVAAAVAAAVGAYLFFSYLLGVPLPPTRWL